MTVVLNTELTPGTKLVLSDSKLPAEQLPIFTVERQLDSGDIFNLFLGRFDGPTAPVVGDDPPPKTANRYAALMEDEEGDPISGEPALLKVLRAVPNQDLAENEALALGILVNRPTDNPNSGFARLVPYLLAQPFRIGERWAHVMPFYEGFVSLQGVLEAFPKGLDYRDMVWMFKRSLAALGYAHSRGLIHGAVTPPHILVHPVDHGAKVIDWSYSVHSPKTSIKAYSPAWKDYYAPEIFEKRFPAPGTDIYMLGKVMIALLGGNLATNTMPDAVPQEIQKLLTRCVHPSMSLRPLDAWDLHEELDRVLERLVGKPKYRRLEMPGA